MSNYVTVPINENGIIVDDNIGNLVAAAMSTSFTFSDIYLYSHGWSLDATRMMDWYNRFSIEFNKSIVDCAAVQPPPFAQAPGETLGVGIHWPSMISEDANNLADYLQQLTFYTMEKRADSVGTHGVYAVLRLILTLGNFAANRNVRINLIGHSFGCKVIASALEQIYSDVISGKVTVTGNVAFNVVLIQGAFSASSLDDPGCYSDVDRLNLRLLVTRSDEDTACGKWFDLAHANVDFFFKHQVQADRALGAVGPTSTTIAAFGGANTIDVATGLQPDALQPLTKRLIVANLTPLHQQRDQSVPTSNDKWSGHHSDIFLPEMYALLSGFLYNNNLPPAPIVAK